MTVSLSDGSKLYGALRRLDGASKVVCCGVFIVCVVGLPSSELPKIASLGGIMVLLWLAAGLSPLLLVKRLGIALPFVSMVGLSVPFLAAAEHPIVMLPGNLVISHEGMWLFVSIMVKAAVCITALSLLGITTPPQELLAALRRLRFPALLLTVLSLTARYLLTLQDEARRMMQARDARGRSQSLLRRVKTTGALVGSLFLRSYERAERVGQAMAARGFDGTLPVIDRTYFTGRDAAVTLLFVAAIAALTLWRK